jgi:hypothetical protein
LYFSPVNAKELYDGLRAGEFYKDGGETDLKIVENAEEESFLTVSDAKPNSMAVKLADGGFMAKGGQIGDSGIITDNNSMFKGKMGVIVGEFDNMWEVSLVTEGGNERTVLVGKRGIDIVKDEYSEGGEITPKLNTLVVNRALEIYNSKGGSSKEDFDEYYDQSIREFGYEPTYFKMKMREIGSEESDDDEYAEGGYMAKGGEIKEGGRVGFLKPDTGRYSYADVLKIDGDKVSLVVRHPKRSQWDNFFTESKERLIKFSKESSEDWKDGRKLVKILSEGGYMAKGGEVYLPVSKNISDEEIKEFVDYVYKFYGKGGTYADDLNGGFTKTQIKKAVDQYIDELSKSSTWGYGDSLDRERVRMILDPEYSLFKDGGQIKKPISKSTTYVPNRDVKDLTIVLKGELKKIKGSDILDGVYLKKKLARAKKPASEKKSEAEEILKSCMKKAEVTETKVDVNDIESLLSAGFDRKDIEIILLGYGYVEQSKIKCDNEFGSSITGVLSFSDDYQKPTIKSIVEGAKKGYFEIGIKYPSFEWKKIVEKYKINKTPKSITRTSGGTKKRIANYEVFTGKDVAIGHLESYKWEGEELREEGDKIGVLDLSKPTEYQKQRDYPAGFNGGYWGIVTKKKEILYDILESLVSQKKGYVKELDVFENGLGGIDYEDVKGKFADGGEVYEDLKKKSMLTKAKIVTVIGFDEAYKYFDREYVVSPFYLIQSAVLRGFITIDEINKDLWDSAVEESEDIQERYAGTEHGIGGSDMNAFIYRMLNGAGIKVGVVDNKYQRMANGGEVEELEIEFEEEDDDILVEYKIKIDDKELEIFGKLKTYKSGRGESYQFEPDYFSDADAQKFHDENWEKIEDQIINAYDTKFGKGGITPREKLEKELIKLQRDLNSKRLITYREGDTSEEEMARQRERNVKLKRFNEILETLRESEKMADGGMIDLPAISERKNKTFYHLIWDDRKGVKDLYFDNKEDAEKKYNSLLDSKEIYVMQLSKDKFSEYGHLQDHNTYMMFPKYADGGEIDEDDMSVKFIDYKGKSIMFEPHFKKYYSNDRQFNSLEKAKKYIDSGSKSSDFERLAYKRGMMARGGRLKIKSYREYKEELIKIASQSNSEDEFVDKAKASLKEYIPMYFSDLRMDVFDIKDADWNKMIQSPSKYSKELESVSLGNAYNKLKSSSKSTSKVKGSKDEYKNDRRMSKAKTYWNTFNENNRGQYLLSAGYSKIEAENLSKNSWDSLNKEVHMRLRNVLLADGGMMGNGGEVKSLESKLKNSDNEIQIDGNKLKIQKKDNPTNFLTITQVGKDSFNIDVTSGSIQNPSSAPNATWFNLGDKYHTYNELLVILKRYGVVKMANGGVSGDKLIEVDGYFKNNNVDDKYLFSSNAKGIDNITEYKNIEVLSVGVGKYDLFYAWNKDEEKQELGRLYFGKWNKGNFGFKYNGKIIYAKGGYMANGGVTFKEKVKSISSKLFKGKKVSPSVQKDYGKTYTRKEAKESAKRIAGAMRAKELRMKKK